MSTSFFTINDIKDALTENKWSSGVTWDLNETTNYEVFDYSDMTDEQKAITKTASKVIDSKVLGANDQVLMNWNTALFTNSNNGYMNSIFGDSSTITEWNSDLSSLTSGYGMFSNTALTSFTSDLSSLTNGTEMFPHAALTSFNSNLSSLTNGHYMFSDSALTSFNVDLSSLTDGYCMFSHAALESFDSDLSSLTNGSFMFYYCRNLTSFDSNLSSLINGYYMFSNTALTTFDSDLSSLTNGDSMFSYCTNLTSFDSDLSSLTNGYQMFYKSALASFNSDLSNLTDGFDMFRYTALTSFDSDLSSLTYGYDMFDGCELDTTSVQNIASTINDLSDDTDDVRWGWGEIHISIGNSTPNTEEETSFNTIASKGWTVYVNGSSTAWTPTASTNLTEGEEQSTPIPFYAKSIQVTEENASYVDANNNYYNIVGAQFIYGDDLSTYGQFTSFEHAVEEISLSLGLTKYTKLTESTEEK